uniref:Uncharacterized protein n=1 Tax=Lepeophtheirus salmonis TaxID=72036 RepID=A0A0K2SW90_LEPSM
MKDEAALNIEALPEKKKTQYIFLKNLLVNFRIKLLQNTDTIQTNVPVGIIP